MSLPKKSVHRGQVYIGVLISVGLFLILSQAVITLVFAAYDLLTFSRARITARHLAQEQIEEIRNVPYDDVGTLGGIPSGIFPQTSEAIRNGLSYTVRTTVVYIDDPFDGQTPIDLLPIDYKRVRVDVSWGGLAASNGASITLITDIAPQGVESIDGGGTLSVQVFDAFGAVVPQAQVRIISDDVTPSVDLVAQTNDNGLVFLPGALACSACYEITVTKDGYSSERTYATTEIANPENIHATVIEGDLTEVFLAIDRVSTIEFLTQNYDGGSFTPLANQELNLRLNKVLGTNDFDEPIYKYEEQIITDGEGRFTLENAEWGLYEVSLPETTNRNIAVTNPNLPLDVTPHETISAQIALSQTDTPGLRVFVTDNSDMPIASASATLSDGLTFEETLLTGSEGSSDFGQVYFSDLETGEYTLTATASGYIDDTRTATVSGYVTETIILNQE